MTDASQGRDGGEGRGVEVVVAVLGEDSESWWAVICPDSPCFSLTSCPRAVYWGGGGGSCMQQRYWVAFLFRLQYKHLD